MTKPKGSKQRRDARGHDADERLDARECASCAAKTGSPELCPSCLHNRSVVATLRRSVEAWRQRANASEEEVKALRSEIQASNAGIQELRQQCGAREDETLVAFVQRLSTEAFLPWLRPEDRARLSKCLGEDLDKYGLVGAVERLCDAWCEADTERRMLVQAVRVALAPPDECADVDLAAYARSMREGLAIALREKERLESKRNHPSLGVALLCVADAIGRGMLGPEAALTVRAPGKGGE